MDLDSWTGSQVLYWDWLDWRPKRCIQRSAWPHPEAARPTRDIRKQRTYASREEVLTDKKRTWWLYSSAWSTNTTVYGQKVILWTDRKPIASISKTSLASATKRLLPDTTSKAYLKNCQHSATLTEVEVECIHAIHFLPVPDHQLRELQREITCDLIII